MSGTTGDGSVVDRRHILYVCTRCNWTQSEAERSGARSGAALFDAVARELVESPARALVRLLPLECMSNCKRPCTVAFAAQGKFTFLFGDLPPTAEAADAVLRCALVYSDKPDGFMKRDERPEMLRKGILGRIPPLPGD